jgi:DNA-binding MarR family transcriptional regulator
MHLTDTPCQFSRPWGPFVERTMKPFENFTDEEITARLSIPMIVDAFWEKEYGGEVPPVTREVGRTLMYLVRKFGNLVPHSLLLEAVAQHAELSKSTVAPFISGAEKLGMVTVVTPEIDARQRLYGFTASQKAKILRATAAPAYAAALAMEQAKQPTNTEFGKTPQNESYYRHIFNRINARNEDVMNKLAKLRHRLKWTIVLTIGTAIGIAVIMQPWAEAVASWSNGKI